MLRMLVGNRQSVATRVGLQHAGIAAHVGWK